MAEALLVGLSIWSVSLVYVSCCSSFCVSICLSERNECCQSSLKGGRWQVQNEAIPREPEAVQVFVILRDFLNVELDNIRKRSRFDHFCKTSSEMES